MMWGYQGTEQRCIRILAPGPTIERTEMMVDSWRNITLKLVRSLLCLEMTRNSEKNTYRVSQKKDLMNILDHLDSLDIGLLLKMVQNCPKYSNGSKWSYGLFHGKFHKFTFFWDTLY